MENLPNEIFTDILNRSNNQALVLTNMTATKLRDKTAPALKELGQIYHSLDGKNSSEIVETCLNSTLTTKAVMMSKTLHDLEQDDIIKIACSSYDHASIILKSYFIQNRLHSYIKSEAMLYTKNKDKINNKKKSQKNPPYLGQTIPPYDVSSMLNILKAWENMSLDFTPVINPIEVVEAITRKGLNYAILVLKYAGELLSGYRLMGIAKCSIEHAKFILGSTTLRNRLKTGHIIDIAKTSLAHTQCVLNNCFILLKEDGIKQIIFIDVEHAALVFNHLGNLLSLLPLRIIKIKPEKTKYVIVALFSRIFYSDGNPFWALYKTQKPEMATLILEAQRIVSLIFSDKDKLNREIALKVMSLSITQAKEILSIPKIEQMLGCDRLEELALKNEEYSALISNFLKTGSNVATTKNDTTTPTPNSYKGR